MMLWITMMLVALCVMLLCLLCRYKKKCDDNGDELPERAQERNYIPLVMFE
jgi:hypothetical protein